MATWGRIFGMCWLLATGALALAQSTAPLSLRDCVALALVRQVDIRLGQNDAAVARDRAAQARSSYYPQISASTTKNWTPAGQPGTNTGVSTAVTVAQNLYDGGLREAQVATARYSLQQTEAVLSRTQQTVVFSVTKAYLSLLRAQALAGVSAQQTTVTEEQLRQVQARIDAGKAAGVDALPIKAQLASARVDTLAAQNSVATSAIQLQQAMGLTPVAGFAVQEVTVPHTSLLPAYDEGLRVALQQRPELREQRAGIGTAKTGITLAKINLLPHPVVAAQYTQPITGGAAHTYSVSAGVSWNLFDGANARSAYHEAQTNLASAQTRAAQMICDITAEVQSAYLTLSSAQERMTASGLNVDAAQQNLDAQQGRYTLGLAVPLDLLNAQLALTTAQSNAVQAQYDYLTALAQLQYALGEGTGK